MGGGTAKRSSSKAGGRTLAPSATRKHGEAVASGGGHQDGDLLLLCQTAASGAGLASASPGLCSAHELFVLLPHGGKDPLPSILIANFL